jgi:hypothetical protein
LMVAFSISLLFSFSLPLIYNLDINPGVYMNVNVWNPLIHA